MLKNRKIHTFVLTATLIVLVPTFVFAQDLGSSNGLFNAPNPKTKGTRAAKKAVKKSEPEKKSSAAGSRRAARTRQRNEALAARKSAADARKNVVAAGKVKNGGVASAKPPSAADKQIGSKEISPGAPLTDTVIKIEQPIAAASPVIYSELFEQAIEEGNVARDAREYVKAEAAYLRAQSMATRDSRAVYGLGNLYSDQQRWEEAERAYRTAIQLEPASSEAYVALSFVLTQPISGVNLGERYAEAEEKAKQAINLDPTSAVAYDQLGAALELRGVIGDETQTAYRKAIELEPNFALAYAHLGRLLRRKGKSNESAAAYRSAIALASDVPTMILVADVMQSQQRYLESEQLLRQALKQDPKNPTALNMLGRALTTRSSYEEAEKTLKRSADISPNSFVSYSLLGSLFLRREKFDDAEKYLMKALKMVSAPEKKRLAQDFEAVGDGYARVGKNKDAARVYQQAVQLDAEKLVLADKLAKARNS